MICEYCNKEQDGKYGSGRFCSEKCARGYASKEKRQEINIKVSKTLIGRKLTEEHKLHIRENHWAKTKTYSPNKKISKCPICESKFKKGYGRFCSIECMGKNQTLRNIAYYERKILEIPFEKLTKGMQKRVLLKEQDNKCKLCNREFMWMGKILIPHLHHKDGNRKNISRGNSELICPNCHSQTDNYCSKNASVEGRKKMSIAACKMLDKKRRNCCSRPTVESRDLKSL